MTAGTISHVESNAMPNFATVKSTPDYIGTHLSTEGCCAGFGGGPSAASGLHRWVGFTSNFTDLEENLSVLKLVYLKQFFFKVFSGLWKRTFQSWRRTRKLKPRRNRSRADRGQSAHASSRCEGMCHPMTNVPYTLGASVLQLWCVTSTHAT